MVDEMEGIILLILPRCMGERQRPVIHCKSFVGILQEKLLEHGSSLRGQGE